MPLVDVAINMALAVLDLLGAACVGHLFLRHRVQSDINMTVRVAFETGLSRKDTAKTGAGKNASWDRKENGDVAVADQHMEDGQALFNKGQHAEAEECFLLARTMYYVVTEDFCCQLRIGRACTQLGRLYLIMKKFALSLEMLREALRMYRCSSEEDSLSVDIAQCLTSLAILFRSQNQYDDAFECLEEAHTILKRSTENLETADLALVLCEKGDCHHELGQDDLAMQARREALRVCRIVHGNDSDHVAALLVNLGHGFQKQGKLWNAKENFEAALDICHCLHGREHETVSSILINIAIVLSEEQRCDMSMQLLNRALKINRLILGEDHEDVACTLYQIAFTCERQGRYDEAISVLNKILAINNRNYGADSLQNARLYCAMIDLRLQFGDKEGALRSAKECIRIYKKRGASDEWSQKAASHVERFGFCNSFKLNKSNTVDSFQLKKSNSMQHVSKKMLEYF